MPDDRTLLEGYLTKADLAREFGVCERTIERWVRLRMLPQPVKIGRQRLWHQGALRKSLERGAA